ncbi:MAG: adenosylmethionine decarboxylase [Chloroflexi bacterium]|nr:adenosylmethionine decarboxylase [Chloroflexota bacterium]
MHLIIDGFRGNKDRLQDMQTVYALLDEYPTRIHMTKIMPPYVFRYVGVKPEDWGISGFVLIAESHITVHTFPEKGYVNVDIFSCKEFDPDQAVAYIRDQLGLEEVDVRVIRRGLEYLPHPHVAPDTVTAERRELAAASERVLA